MSRHARSKGLALVIVLFILTIMSVSVAWLAEEMVFSLRHAENVRDSEQAWQVLAGSEAWAVSVLARDRQENAADHPGESWKNLGSAVTIERGQLSTDIEDVQGRFNINNLLDEAQGDAPQGERPRVWIPAFQRLLLALELDPGLADAVLDWLDTDQEVRGINGAEDNDYLGLTPPYRAANRAFSDISELLWVKGFDEQVLQKLAPYVIALPVKGVPININTASPQLLRILGRNLLSIQDAEQLVADIPPETGYSIEDFLKHDSMAGEQDIAVPLIDDKSDYFVINSRAVVGKARMSMNSVVERKDGLITVIKRVPVL